MLEASLPSGLCRGLLGLCSTRKDRHRQGRSSPTPGPSLCSPQAPSAPVPGSLASPGSPCSGAEVEELWCQGTAQGHSYPRGPLHKGHLLQAHGSAASRGAASLHPLPPASSLCPFPPARADTPRRWAQWWRPLPGSTAESGTGSGTGESAVSQAVPGPAGLSQPGHHAGDRHRLDRQSGVGRQTDRWLLPPRAVLLCQLLVQASSSLCCAILLTTAPQGLWCQADCQLGNGMDGRSSGPPAVLQGCLVSWLWYPSSAPLQEQSHR